jgi:DNA-binding NtrC family response regulator
LLDSAWFASYTPHTDDHGYQSGGDGKDANLKTLQATDDNRTRATDILGITRRTRQNKLKEHGVQ